MNMWKGFRFGMLLQLAVGPVCLFVFHAGAGRGFAAALGAVLAAALADALYIAAAACGVGALLERRPGARRAAALCGGAVLMLFGARDLLGALAAAPAALSPGRELLSAGGGLFARALLLTLTNPMTILFWAGAFAERAAREQMDRRALAAFGAGAVLSTLFFLSLAALAGAAAGRFLPGAALAVLNGAVGAALLAFGARGVFRGLRDKKGGEKS